MQKFAEDKPLTVFRELSVHLTATIGELLERMRQAAYDEGYEDARSASRIVADSGTVHQLIEQRHL